LLHCASKKGHVELARLLIEHLSDSLDIVDVNGNSALHLAAYSGHAEIVDCLLNLGCNSTLTNLWGLTAEEEGSKYGDRITSIFQCMRDLDMARKDFD
jgi:ankyrin repeat protein